jgi:hypothetical protein
MPEILETLSTYIARIEKVQDQMNKPIVLSTDVQIPTLKDGDIEKVPIAWPLYGVGMFYTVTVPKKKHIPRHSHDEDIFRYVIRGSLIINDSIKVSEGMWFVVRANTPYEIETESGYKVVARYGPICLTAHTGGKHWIDETDIPAG